MAAIDEGVLVGRGSWFIAEKGTFVLDSMFFRATFAAASEDKMTDAIERFSIALKRTFEV